MMSWLTGLLILLGEALGVLLAAVTLAVAHAMVRPRRLTFGVAVARGLPTDPVEAQLTGEDVVFTFPDGKQSPGWRIMGDDPSGPVVILTHGWSTSRYASLAKAYAYVPGSAAVVAYDMRGPGDSKAKFATLGHRETGDLLAVMEQSSRGPVVLAGSSLGAGIALEAACKSSRVVGVIADGPYRFASVALAGRLKRLGCPPWPVSMLALGLLRLRWRRVAGYDRLKQAAELRCPLLVLHGTDDPICPLHDARLIASAAKSGRLVEFDGGGHGGLIYVDGRRYELAVQRFLEDVRHESGGSAT
ncbi:MAG: alpha/beta hydrolase [Phycisphaeraceae bacterium]|nr:alpha/beta hydrolase [Phycisphaeraceae bacterium]